MQDMRTYASALPGWLIALIVIAAGWVAAVVVRFVLTRLLTLLHFNQLCTRTGAVEFLRKGEVRSSPAELLGGGLYWIIVIGFCMEAARVLDIGAAVEFRQRAVAAIPAFLSAGLVLLIGAMAVAFLSGLARTLIRNAGSPYANLWSRIIRWAGSIVMVAIAVEQAEIRGSVFVGLLYIVLTAIAFGMALAFGLGCKDMARQAMERLIADLKERHRDDAPPDMES